VQGQGQRPATYRGSEQIRQWKKNNRSQVLPGGEGRCGLQSGAGEVPQRTVLCKQVFPTCHWEGLRIVTPRVNRAGL
jgi:hypothetical protein